MYIVCVSNNCCLLYCNKTRYTCMYKDQYSYFEFEFEFVPAIGTIGFLIFIYFGTKMILCREHKYVRT